MILRFYKEFYLSDRFFTVMIALALFFIAGYMIPWLLLLAWLLLIVVATATIIETLVLFQKRNGITGSRSIPERLSNGDDNDILLHVSNHYLFTIQAVVIDEVPFEFQVRDKTYTTVLQRSENKTILYSLRPTKRGLYSFGRLNVFASTILQLVQRRFTLAEEKNVPVYPGFTFIKKYDFLTVSNQLKGTGSKKVRKVKRNFELDKIRDYIRGDDARDINWKATARTGKMMLNQYQDERAQPIYAIINIGRVMKMPFNGLSLLDYAINSSLVMLNTALKKEDKVGLMTFHKEPTNFLLASKKKDQLKLVLETLYHQKEDFLEANYEQVSISIRRQLQQRSLIFMYTNFESYVSLQRELPYLKAIAKKHFLVLIFFENVELTSLLDTPANDVESIYIKTIAQKFKYEKERCVKELNLHGIHALLTTPENLTITSINKYLEIKTKNLF